MKTRTDFTYRIDKPDSDGEIEEHLAGPADPDAEQRALADYLRRQRPYPLLSRLRRAGRIGTSWRESPTGPPRRYYTLTPDGELSLEQFRVQWTAFRTGVDRILGTEQR